MLVIIKITKNSCLIQLKKQLLVTPSATENIHNSIRSLYVEPPLIFSEVLAEKSKTCVSKMAQGHLGISDHPCEENGESIYLTKQSIQSGPLSPDKLMSLAADAW